MDAVLMLFDQWYEAPPLAVRVVDCPVQIEVTPEIAQVGAGLKVSCTAQVL